MKKSTQEIKTLLDRYFEGTTSNKDENELTAYFSSDEVSDELKKYRPIFNAILKEQQKMEVTKPDSKPEQKPAYFTTRRLYWMIGVAASLLLTFGIFLKTENKHNNAYAYVIIGKVKYEDLGMVKKYALSTIDQICEPTDANLILAPLDFLDN